jgi:hypothetical protein
VKGLRTALVLLPPDLGADPLLNPFEQWLDTAGWAADALQLRPSSTHATLGWKKCAVDECDRPAWGLKNNGLCEGCKTQWHEHGKPDRAVFDRQPPKRHRIQQHLELCWSPGTVSGAGDTPRPEGYARHIRSPSPGERTAPRQSKT